MARLIDKPRLMEKLKSFHDYVRKNNGQIGTKQRGIDLNFNNACNLTCKYCFNNLSSDQKKRFSQRQKQIELSLSRGEAHIGQTKKTK